MWWFVAIVAIVFVMAWGLANYEIMDEEDLWPDLFPDPIYEAKDDYLQTTLFDDFYVENKTMPSGTVVGVVKYRENADSDGQFVTPSMATWASEFIEAINSNEILPEDF